MDLQSDKKSCVCPLGAWCERHNRALTAAEHPRCEAILAAKRRTRTRPKAWTQREFIGPPRPPGMRKPAKPQRQGPPKPCGGCQGRKKIMNAIVPGSGDLVEKITTKTGIKGWWEGRD